MNFKKKIISWFVLVVLSFAMYGCGNKLTFSSNDSDEVSGLFHDEFKGLATKTLSERKIMLAGFRYKLDKLKINELSLRQDLVDYIENRFLSFSEVSPNLGFADVLFTFITSPEADVFQGSLMEVVGYFEERAELMVHKDFFFSK